jgi:excisionase family DNA binding protein
MGLITTIKASLILKITPVRVRQLIKDGQLKSVKVGRDHLLDNDEVEQYNANGRRSGGRPRKKMQNTLAHEK